MARKYLEKTEKPRIRKELLPYLNGEKSLAMLESGSEKMRINRLSKRLREIVLEEKGLDEVGAKYMKFDKRDVLDYLKNCKVSEADVDVLALALYEARYGQHAIIGEKDIDFKQAIDLIKKESPKLGKNLDYVEVYRKEYAAA